MNKHSPWSVCPGPAPAATRTQQGRGPVPVAHGAAGTDTRLGTGRFAWQRPCPLVHGSWPEAFLLIFAPSPLRVPTTRPIHSRLEHICLGGLGRGLPGDQILPRLFSQLFHDCVRTAGSQRYSAWWWCERTSPRFENTDLSLFINPLGVTLLDVNVSRFDFPLSWLPHGPGPAYGPSETNLSRAVTSVSGCQT